MPIQDDDGNIIGLYAGFCAIEWPQSCSQAPYVPDIPYGSQTEENSLVYEDGYMLMRGYMTEGRWLVFESNGHALSNPSDDTKQFEATAATANHETLAQRWVVHALTEEGTLFNITSAVDGKYLSQHNSLSDSVTGAEIYNITYIGNSQYVLQKENGDYTNIQSEGTLEFVPTPIPYTIWSVTYSDSTSS
jgi:phospholipase C